MAKRSKPVKRLDDLCHAASDLLKRAGFELHCVSRRSEACYYKWPGHDELIRVAAHGKDDWRGLGKVVAKITFNGTILCQPGTMRLSDDKFEQVVAQAIGRYFLAVAKGPEDRDFSTTTIHPEGLRNLADAIERPKPPSERLVRLMSKETSNV